MNRLKLLIASAAIAIFGFASGASPQTVQQTGSVTPGHLPCWVTSGVVQDCGSSTGSPRVGSLGIYGSGGTPFAITSTSSPGLPTGQYVQLGMGVTTAGATISVTPFGGLSTVPLNININGTIIPIGGSNWLSAIIDSQIGSTQGQILYRGSTLWSALNPGSSGQVLQTLGAGANPQWASAGGTGSVTSVATGTGLTGGPVTSSGTISLSVPVSVANGGTGATSLAAHGVILGNTTGTVVVSAPGTSGTILQSNGPGSDPTWNSVAGSGTVTSVGTGTGLTGGTITTSGTVSLASITDGQILNNQTGGSAAPTPTATPRLGIAGTTKGTLTLAGNSSGTLTIQPTAAAGSGTVATFQAATGTVGLLDVADQTLSGGANVTSGNLGTKSSGTLTIDCGAVPLQYVTNGGAFTLAAPANDGSCILLVTNNASAGIITPSGFSVGISTGDVVTTTNTSKFSWSIWRINGTSGYRVAAHQ